MDIFTTICTKCNYSGNLLYVHHTMQVNGSSQLCPCCKTPDNLKFYIDTVSAQAATLQFENTPHQAPIIINNQKSAT